MLPDRSGQYAALYRPIHMIGLELGISVASAGLRGEATGAPTGFRGDAVATAKCDLQEGETLDGEGGFTVWGKILRAEDSLGRRALPIGLAHKVKLTKPVTEGAVVSWDDVAVPDDETVRFRKEMEKTFAPKKSAAA
jgi:predicted homoserine dehydrogenase-like protein